MKKLIYLLLFLAPSVVFGQTLLDQINDYRARHIIIRKLRADSLLYKECKRHVERMIRAGGKIFHDRKTNRYEVVTNANDPLAAFINSKPHRKILLTRSVRRIGYYTKDGITCIRLDE